MWGDDMKLIVADLDGTLVLKQETTQQTKKTIHVLKEKGYLFTIATGRHYHAAQPFVEMFDVDLPVICSNGAFIYDYKKKEVLHQQLIEEKVVSWVMKACDEVGVDFLVYTTQAIYATERAKQKLMARLGDVKVHVKERNELDQITSQGVVKVLVIEDEEYKRNSLRMKLNQEPTIKYVQSQPAFLDIGHKLSEKGNALVILSNILHIDLQDILAIGDQENDISMIKHAGVGVAMGDGEPLLLDVADFITKSFHEEGFSYAIKHFISNI